MDKKRMRWRGGVRRKRTIPLYKNHPKTPPPPPTPPQKPLNSPRNPVENPIENVLYGRFRIKNPLENPRKRDIEDALESKIDE